jgi:hypothetical protein
VNADHLDEFDRVQLLEAVQISKMREAQLHDAQVVVNALTTFLARKYGLNDGDRMDADSGTILRLPVPESEEEGSDDD